MEEPEENKENFNKIKVFFSDDEKLKILGELLSNKSSRDIIKLLIEKEMYINEIAKKLDLRVNLVLHHVKKMQEIGLLEIIHKKITEQGNDHRYFRINPGMFILPNEPKEEIKEKSTLKKVFKEGIKFASIGISAIISYAIIGFAFDSHQVLEPIGYVEPSIPLNDFWNIIIPTFVIIMGLIVERIFSYRKKRKK